jgi:hypothetical protein
MFKTNGLCVDVDGLTLLNDLQQDLQLNNIQLLHSIKPVNDNIMISCPSHKDGQERKPSCGMSLVDTRASGKIIPAGTVHCFTCGYTADLTSFISFCFGYRDGGLYGNNWLKTKYRTTLLETPRDLQLNIDRSKPVEKYPTIPDTILDNYAYYCKYLADRGISKEVCNKFSIGCNPEDMTITLPVKDLKGNIKFIQTRNIYSKFYFIPAGIKKTDFIFGGYECIIGNYKSVWIVESIFNALTLWELGIPAVALLGTGGGQQYNLLKMLPTREFIIALDNDTAGIEGTYKIIRKLNTTKVLKILQYNSNDKRDINDLGAEVLSLPLKNIL